MPHDRSEEIMKDALKSHERTLVNLTGAVARSKEIEATDFDEAVSMVCNASLTARDEVYRTTNTAVEQMVEVIAEEDWAEVKNKVTWAVLIGFALGMAVGALWI